jgi:hypothetical protein
MTKHELNRPLTNTERWGVKHAARHSLQHFCLCCHLQASLATPQTTIIEELLALLADQRLVHHGSSAGADWTIYLGEESWHWSLRKGQKPSLSH